MDVEDMMVPSDDWIDLLNFYIIVASGGELTSSDFTDERLVQAFRKNPGSRFEDMTDTADELVLEFQAETEETEPKPTSRNGKTQETPDGPLSIPLPHLSHNV